MPVGGCCAPNRWKHAGTLYQDNGENFDETGDKITGISDAPLYQTVSVEGSYMQYMTDDNAMNMTLLPSVNMADKQSILYGVAFDRAIIITYRYLSHDRQVLGNFSTGVLRNSATVPDVALPRYTRYIEISIYGSRANPLCFTYIYAGLYVDIARTTVSRLCSRLITIFQYLALINFLLIPTCFAIMAKLFRAFEFPPPVRFLCRQSTQPLILCIFMMIGSFIFSQAWNLMNSQSLIFDEWLPRAAKIFLCYAASYRSRIANILGTYVTLVLFALRVAIDLPSFVVTYARDLLFLVLNVAAAVPAIMTYMIVLLFFLVRAFTFRECDICRMTVLEVEDVEEQYVKHLFIKQRFEIVATNHEETLALDDEKKILRLAPDYYDECSSRIPLVVKSSLTLLTYCLAQLIPVLLTQMIGVGGVVPTHICAWSPYLTQFQFHPDPMAFARKSFLLMQIAIYIATAGAGGFCILYAFGIIRRITKDILRLRRGDYGIFKGKKNNDIDIDDAIRFLGVCVGFGFTGTMYFMVEVSIIGTFIALLILLDRVREWFLNQVGYGTYFASFFVAILVQMIQKRTTSILFIKYDARFSLQNRGPFLHYWYFMMFTSMTRAFTSYILRTLKLLLRYPIFSLRVDRNAETWSVRRGDGGFTGYCGMLLAEHEYNNPVLLVFIECLLHHIHPKRPLQRCQAHRDRNDVEDHDSMLIDARPMDDIYQYTASAVQENSNEPQVAEKNDPLINAFNNFGFGKRWTSLVDTVKKGARTIVKSEQVIAVTRNDLQEFAQVLKDDTTHVVDKIAIPTNSASPPMKADGKGKARATSVVSSPSVEKEQPLSSASPWSYISQLSSQLPSAIRLPDNIDLGRLHEEMNQGTRFAEQYLQKFGTEVMNTLSKTIAVIEPEDVDSQALVGRTSTSSRAGRVFATRKEQQLAEMRANPETFLKDCVPADLDSSTLDLFDADKRTEDISKLLEEYPELREMMDRLVPVEISYTLFWKRYFYHVWKTEEDDRKRHVIAEAAENEEDFRWDSDDEEEGLSSKKTGDGDKSLMKQEVIPKVDLETKEPVTPAKKVVPESPSKQEENSEDSDSDWE
ncbi:hypothetical protein BX666DRAFT_2028039 [Dichotomocladium elegans]|nr:hypothetical protein BX666DRAFT_2028039 [Dichotomocladium elegans]